MTGLHTVRKRLANGRDRWFVYAWRGGPRIHIQDGVRPVIGPEILALAIDARRSRRDGATLSGVIQDYRASPDYTRLRDKTKVDYRLWLDRIEERFGDAALAVFEDNRMRGVILDWRDQWAGQPRTADRATGMLAMLLEWARDRSRLSSNPAAGIKKLHRANRSDLIWEDHHWEVFSDAPPLLLRALRLAALTGLRLGDLVRLNWCNVGERAISVATRKRGGRAVIPIYGELGALLDDIGRKEGPVLLHSKGKAWTEDGLKTAFQRAKPKGFDRRIHDLRGTFVTFLCVKGFTDQEIARIIGWGAARIGDVRARYVDEARVVVALAERMSA